MEWFNQVLQGVLLGGYYALIATGLTFMFGVMRIINLAHGSLAVVAAYLVWAIAEQWDLSLFVGLLLILPVMALVGWLLQLAVLERSLRSGQLVRVLEDCSPSVEGLFLYYPGHRHVPAALRALIDTIRATGSSTPARTALTNPFLEV